MLRYILTLLVLVFSVNQVSALNVYEQANDKTNVVFEAKPGDRLISIINQDQWLKVGSPKDGKVGWVKIVDLQGRLPQRSGIIYEQRFFTNNDDKALTRVHRTVEYSDSSKINQEQVDEIVAELQKCGEQFQRYMQAMLQDLDLLFPMSGADTVIVPEQTTTSAKPAAVKTEQMGVMDKVKHILTAQKDSEQTEK